MTENPVLAALEAYRRAHPHEADAVDEAMARGPEDSEAVSLVPAVDSGRESATASEQLPLSDPDADAIGKFQRPGDAAETQRLAALRAYPTTGTARRRVLDAIGGRGPLGVTDEEMQNWLGMNPSTQRPRRVELVEGGWVEDGGIRRPTASRHEAVVWILTQRGQREWQPIRSVTWEP